MFCLFSSHMQITFLSKFVVVLNVCVELLLKGYLQVLNFTDLTLRLAVLFHLRNEKTTMSFLGEP